MKIIVNMNINNCLHKVEDNKIMYFNGIKWLVREYSENNKKAQEKYKKLKETKHLKDA